jgi:hypothetical protein
VSIVVGCLRVYRETLTCCNVSIRKLPVVLEQNLHPSGVLPVSRMRLVRLSSCVSTSWVRDTTVRANKSPRGKRGASTVAQLQR